MSTNGDVEHIEDTGTGVPVEPQLVNRRTRSAARAAGQAISVDNSKQKKTPKPKAKQKKTYNRPTVASLSVAFEGMQDQTSTQGGEIRDMRHDITRVNSSLNSLESKFDRFLSSMERNSFNHGSREQAVTPIRSTGNPRPARIAEPEVSVVYESSPEIQARHRNVVVSNPLPPPSEIVREQNRDGHIDRQIAREEYSAPAGNGKVTSINDNGFMKPYMYLDREGIQTVRQKLDIRATMTYHEYVSCLLALIHDSSAFIPSERDDIIRHFHAVAIDAIVRPWPSVRRWTQLIWDHVEKGTCKWSSYTFIQNERIRVSYMNMSQSSSASANSNSRKHEHDMRYVLCRDFNSVGGCCYTASHDDGVVRYLHSCTHCDGIGRKSSHSYQRCRIRLESQNGGHSGSGQYPEQRQWSNSHHRSGNSGHNNHSSGQSHGNKYGGQHSSQSKNA